MGEVWWFAVVVKRNCQYLINGSASVAHQMEQLWMLQCLQNSQHRWYMVTFQRLVLESASLPLFLLSMETSNEPGTLWAPIGTTTVSRPPPPRIIIFRTHLRHPGGVFKVE